MPSNPPWFYRIWFSKLQVSFLRHWHVILVNVYLFGNDVVFDYWPLQHFLEMWGFSQAIWSWLNKQTFITIFSLSILIFLDLHTKEVLSGFINTYRSTFNLNFDIVIKLWCKVHMIYSNNLQSAIRIFRIRKAPSLIIIVQTIYYITILIHSFLGLVLNFTCIFYLIISEIL